MSLSQEIATFVSQYRDDDLPERVTEVTKQALLDAIGVTLAAGTLGEGVAPFIRLAAADGGQAESTILGFGRKASAPMAAFANGAMAHAMDFEDAHDTALVHSNAATIPAALAVAEALGGVSGKRLIAAVAIGSELVCRMGLSIRDNMLEYGWYMPPILNAFGATAAAGRLLGLTARQMLDAFSLTMCQAVCSAEITNSPKSEIRSIRDAFAAKAGVLSAMLAKEGVTGFEQPFEGQRAFYHAFARGNYDAAALTRGLGIDFACADISFKPWPSCRGTHPYIEGVLSLMAGNRIDPSEISDIVLVISPVNRMLCEPAEAKRQPASAIGAKFSLPFVVATAVHHGNVALEHFTPEALRNPHVLRIAERVRYEVDDGRALRDTLGGEVRLRAGSNEWSAAVRVPLGNPDHPMTLEQLERKFADNAKYAARPLSDTARERIVRAISELERVDDIRDITAEL